MRKILFLFLILLTFSSAYTQKKIKPASVTVAEIRIPMSPEYWKIDTSVAQFVTYKNTSAIKGKDGKQFQAFLKKQKFATGTIEFDVELTGAGFPGINFRMSEDGKTGENFYIRSFGPVNANARTTLQYATLIDGVSMWDLSDEYQAGAVIKQNAWNHVKLVVSARQMRAYVNDMAVPALSIPALESSLDSGGVSISGNVIYSNFVISPGRLEGLSPEPGYSPLASDTRYLRNWMVSGEIDFPFGSDLVIPLPSMYGNLKKSSLPDSNVKWSPLKAENRGIVNLSRLFGHKPNDARRLAWIKTTLHSDKVQERTLNLGFSDEVWVFINGNILYADKNYYGTPQQKFPNGRCTIENTSIKLQLQKGDNVIMIALANYFYGWGIVARLDDTNEISFK